MTVVLYRPSLDARSGAGQLLEMQWRGLSAAGVNTLLACDRGALKFWLRTGVRARRRSVAELERLQARGALLVDHGLALPSAEVVFVHNVFAEAARHLPARTSTEPERREREFFASLGSAATVVANSKLAAAALHEHYGIARERLTVLYPGFDSRRYSQRRAEEQRAAARASLGVGEAEPLIGLVTSGDFIKRGLDLFLECAERIRAVRPDAQFLVVGSKRLPEEARAHALVRTGTVRYRPKSRRPEPWFAALDLFLYPARFEEYGMVVAEAQAMGVAVVTSRRVGASESLPVDYAQWLSDEPKPAALTERALALLEDATLRARLAAAAAVSVATLDERSYVEGTRQLLAAQNRRLK